MLSEVGHSDEMIATNKKSTTQILNISNAEQSYKQREWMTTYYFDVIVQAAQKPKYFAEHKQVLLYLWTVVINVGVFLAMYRYRKYTMFGHFIIGFGVVFVTLLFTFPIILDTKIPSAPSRYRTHQITGYTIVVAMFLQVVLGGASRLLSLCKFPSVGLYYMNKTHLVLGYILLALNKFQVYYYIRVDYRFWLLIGQDCLFLIFLIARKMFFPTLESTIQPKVENAHQIKKIMSLSQLSAVQNTASDQPKASYPSKDYCIFANYVYDLQPLKWTHPVGYQILELVKNREVDRFIYGMFRAEKLPNLPASSHSFKSFDLLGPPVACIDIPTPFVGMPSQPFEVRMTNIKHIYEKTRIYQINFAYKDPIKFKGYEQIEQLGRFHSLTVNNQVTRLYTSVNFLYQSNISLLHKLGIEYKDHWDFIMPAVANAQQNQLVPTSSRTIIERQGNNVIPMLLKVYDEGTLPNLLISQQATNIIMSPLRGLGLCLGQLQKGTIMIIAGGTGIYPFSDLIDLLYKNYKATSSPWLQKQIFDQNPILKTHGLTKFKYRLLFACENLQDIHPITLAQLHQLDDSNHFSSLVKIKSQEDTTKVKLTLVNKNFEEILDGELKEIDDLVKVWLCGPPKMGENICEYFRKSMPNRDIVLLV